MYVLTALSQTLHLDLVRRGKGREGRMENAEKCKRMGKRREGKTKEERSRENKREKRMEGEERRKERKERHPLNFNFTI